MTARIYKPARNAMQSGTAKTKLWVLDYEPEAPRTVEPLVQAMNLNQTISDVAKGQYWIHPALTEVVENALLGVLRVAAEQSAAL